MTSSASMQPPGPFSPGLDAGAPGGQAGVAGEQGGDTAIKSILSPTANPIIDAAVLRTLELARAAGEAGEVPVDVVVLLPEGVVPAEAANAREIKHDPTAYAEIRAPRAAGVALGDSHLDGCTLAITLEPCAMCAGAIVLTWVARFALGAWEPRTRTCGPVRGVVCNTHANHQVKVRAGPRVQESQELLTTFLADRR